MKRIFTSFSISIVILIITVLIYSPDAFAQATAGATITAGEANQTPSLRMQIIDGENTARFLVREQLVNLDFPNDAVGETDAVTTGVIVFDDSAAVISNLSSFVVDVTGLETDSDRRNGYMHENILETENYPTVTLVPLQTRGLEFPLPANGEITFDIIGNLTIRGVSQPTSWRVNAEVTDGIITGTARTEFTFEEFEIEKPSVGILLSVSDAIRLEYDFAMEIEEL